MADTADGWPEFSIPNVGENGEVTPPASSGVTSGSAPAATDPEGRPADGTRPEGAGAPKTPDEMIPKYRFDEVNTRLSKAEADRQALLQEFTGMRNLLGQVLAAQQAQKQQASGEAVDPRKQKILNQLLELDPRLGSALELGALKDRLTSALDRLEALETTTHSQQAESEGRWKGYAQESLSAVHDAIAPLYLGEGKVGKDLDPDMAQHLTNLFVAWVGKDAARIQRYDRQDASLRQEFVKDFTGRYVDPLRRPATAQAAAQARRTGKLPVGGSTSSPMGTPAPKVDNQDEDAVFKRGWAMTQQIMGQQ